MRTNDTRCLLLFALLLGSQCDVRVSAAEGSGQTVVELVGRPPRHSAPGLATQAYAPSKLEEPFFQKLATEERSTGSSSEDYDINKKTGKYVGWFGIVRKLAEDVAAKRTTVTVEHKYFDGLTDAHIQAVSFNGSGDFETVLAGVDLGIAPLSLVKVYGVAVQTEGKLPRVDAKFVRVWPWGGFTFLDDYGTQRGNQEWRKLNEVALEDIYDPHPGTEYYLQRLGPKPDDPALRESFRRRVIAATATPGADVREMAIQLADAVLAGTREDMDEAIVAAGKRNADHVVVAALIEGLKSDDDRVRSNAAETLGSLRAVAKSSVPALIEAIQDNNDFVCHQAALALGEIGPGASDAVPALINSLKDRDHYLRGDACEALGTIRLASKDAVAALVTAMKDEDDHVRWCAVGALCKLGRPANSAIDELIDRLQHDDDTNVRWNAAFALGAVDSKGDRVVGPLIAALAVDDETVRRFAAMSLGTIGDKASAAVPTLQRLLTDSDPGVRVAAAGSLWKIEGNTEDSLPALERVMQEKDGNAMMWAVAEVADIGHAAKHLIPALRTALSFDHKYVQASAAEALGRMEQDGMVAIPDLVKLLQHNSAYVRAHAAQALWRIDHRPAAIAALVSELRAQDTMAQGVAIETLSEIGPAARESLPALRDLLSNRDFQIREEAAAAITKIDPTVPKRSN